MFENNQTISILMTSINEKYQLEGYYVDNEGKVLRGVSNRSKKLNDGSMKYYKEVQVIPNGDVSKALRTDLQNF